MKQHSCEVLTRSKSWSELWGSLSSVTTVKCKTLNFDKCSKKGRKGTIRLNFISNCICISSISCYFWSETSLLMSFSLSWRPPGSDLGHPTDATGHRGSHPGLHRRRRDQQRAVGLHAAGLDRHLLQQLPGDPACLKPLKTLRWRIEGALFFRSGLTFRSSAHCFQDEDEVTSELFERVWGITRLLHNNLVYIFLPSLSSTVLLLNMFKLLFIFCSHGSVQRPHSCCEKLRTPSSSLWRPGFYTSLVWFQPAVRLSWRV